MHYIFEPSGQLNSCNAAGMEKETLLHHRSITMALKQQYHLAISRQRCKTVDFNINT